jgi:hypothetical protein
MYVHVHGTFSKSLEPPLDEPLKARIRRNEIAEKTLIKRRL